jgi:hypothetical protein
MIIRKFVQMNEFLLIKAEIESAFIDGETSKESKVIASLIMVCKLTVDSQAWDGNNDDRWAGFYKKAKKTLKEAKEFFNLK